MSSDWITGQAFIPEIGKKYEISVGIIAYRGVTGERRSRIRVEGAHSSQWIDLETGVALDPRIANYVVQAFREIE